MAEDFFPKKGKNKGLDEVELVIAKVLQKKQKSRVTRILNTLCVFPLGVAAGFYGITYQSLWVAVGIHLAWNLVMPLIMVILGAIVVIAIYAIYAFKDTLVRIKFHGKR